MFVYRIDVENHPTAIVFAKSREHALELWKEQHDPVPIMDVMTLYYLHRDFEILGIQDFFIEDLNRLKNEAVERGDYDAAKQLTDSAFRVLSTVGVISHEHPRKQ